MPENKPILLSILICHLVEREEKFSRLRQHLASQVLAVNADVEILIETDNGELSIGAKRNKLLLAAHGDYVCFCDDDDEVPAYFVEELLTAIKSGPDVVGMVGSYREGTNPPKKFVHSTQYTEWFEKDNVYYRPPNHLNCVKRSLALKAGFPDKDHAEDYEYSMKLVSVMEMDCDCNQVEVFIDKVMYYYLKP